VPARKAQTTAENYAPSVHGSASKVKPGTHPGYRILTRTQRVLDGAAALAHLLAVRAARTGRACNAVAATDACQAARLLWLVSERLVEEVAA
jgi:hypothetical protein